MLVVVTEVSTTVVIKMNLRHLSLTAKLTNQFHELDVIYLADNNSSLDSDDDFLSGCPNVSHHY